MNEAFAMLEKRITAWAMGVDDIRAAVVVGSRARTKNPGDEWSDLDLLLFTTDPARYIDCEDWLAELGAYWATFIEPTADGQTAERRVLFEGGLDVDFVPMSLAGLQQAQQSTEVPDVVRRGVRILVDKDGSVAAVLSDLPEPAPPAPPAAERFLNTVNDFWYHTVWTAKKLRRGELWTALGCLNSYLRWHCLLPMIEWHTSATQGWDTDTWLSGRFLEQWADPRVVERLRGVFSPYDEAGSWAALFRMMDLFRWLAGETADRLGYRYPAGVDKNTTAYVQALFDGRSAD